MTRRRFFSIAVWLVALVLLLAVVRGVPLDQTLATLRGLKWWQIAALIGANLLVLLLLNSRWWVILLGYGRQIPFLPLLGYRLATFGVSYFTPGPHFGGEPLQVLLVEREQQVPRSTAFAAMTLDKSLELLVNFLFLLCGLFLIVQQQLLDGPAGVGAIFVLACLLLVPGGYLYGVARGRTPVYRMMGGLAGLTEHMGRDAWSGRLQKAGRVIQESESEMGQFFRRAPAALLLALLFSLAAWAVMIGEFWLMLSFLGLSPSPMQLITVMTAARLALLMLLPAGLGALEAGQVMAFGLVGLNPALGISASLIIRARDIFLGGIGLWWGSKKLSTQYLNNASKGGINL